MRSYGRTTVDFFGFLRVQLLYFLGLSFVRWQARCIEFRLQVPDLGMKEVVASLK